MAPRSILAQLVVALRDDASRGAKALVGNLKALGDNAGAFASKMNGAKWGSAFAREAGRARASAQEMAAALSGGVGWGDRFSQDLLKLKIAPREFARVRDSWNDLQRALANAPGGRTAYNVLGAQGEWRKRQLAEIVAVRTEMARLREEAQRPIGLVRRGARFAAGAAGIYGGGYIAQRAARGTAIAGASDQRETFRQGLAGLNAEDVARISAASEGLAAKYPSISKTDIRELARGARNLTGDVAKGLALLPEIVRARVAIQSATGGAGDGELEQLLKSADIAGLQDDPARFKTFLESFAKAVQVEGKQISAGDYLSFYRRAKMAGSGFSDAFIAAAAPSLIQELGGPTAGTALATFFGQMAGGRAKKETLANQEKAGLRGKDGVLVDRQAFISDPFEWTQRHIAPLMQKSGVDMSSAESMIDFLIPLFSDRNAAEIASKFILQRDQILRNQRMYAGAKGLGAAEEARKEDPFVAATGALNSLRNAAAALAAPAVPAATSALNTFADTVNGLATRLHDNPELAKKASAVATGAVAGAGIIGSIRAAMALWQGGGVSGAIGQGLRGAARGGILGSLAGGLLSPILALRDAGEIKRPTTPIGHRMGQEIPPDAWERSRRVRDEFMRDPEGFRGRALMRASGDATSGAAADGAAAGQSLTQALASGIAAGAPAVLAQGQSIFDRLKALFASGADIPVRVAPGGSEGHRVFQSITSQGSTPAAPARGSGGSVAAGGLYRVNEYGEEFFQPTEDGRIIDPRRRAGGGAHESMPVTVTVSPTINVNGASNPRAVAREVTAEIERGVQSALRAAFADLGPRLA